MNQSEYKPDQINQGKTGLEHEQKYFPISWIEERWEIGNTTKVALQTSGDVVLIINPREHYMGLQVDGSGIDFNQDSVGIDSLRNVTLRKTGEDAVCEVQTQREGLSVAYYFLRNIAVLIQQHNETPAKAIRDSVNGFRDLLQGFRTISEATEIGILGEIMVLQYLVEDCNLPLNHVVQAWLGPEREEHDFAFAHCDIEVKTTSGEERRHKISSRSQLSTTLNKELLFASVQLTRTTQGGETLTEAVDKLRSQIQDERLLSLLDTRLARAGFILETRRRFTTKWLLRSEIEFYRVDDDFPRLLGVLDSRITDISYRVFVGGLPVINNKEINKKLSSN